MPAILNALSYSLPQTSHLAILTTLSSHRFDHAIVFTYPQHRLYKRWRLLPPKKLGDLSLRSFGLTRSDRQNKAERC